MSTTACAPVWRDREERDHGCGPKERTTTVTRADRQTHRDALSGAAAGQRSVAARNASHEGFRAHRRLLRWGLLGAAVLVVLVIIVWPELKPGTARIQVSSAPVRENVPTDRDTAVDAKFNGTDRYGRPFIITAPQAENSGASDGGLRLTQPVSDMTLADGRKVHLTADRGIYNPDTRIVDLYGNVVFIDDNGYRVETSAATIKLDEALITGAEPVTGYASFGQVDGVGFRIVDSGASVFVDGPARMRITSAQPQLR